MHPSQLSDLLRERYPAVDSLSPSLLHCYADLILKLASNRGKGHKGAGENVIPTGALAIHCRSLQKRFGLDGFRQINEMTNCVEHTRNWSVDEGTTKAYWLTERGKKMIEETRLQAMKGEENRLLDHMGKSIRKRENGIYTARDSRGCNAVTEASIEWAVPVNLEAIDYVLGVGAELIFPEAGMGRLTRTDIALRAIHSCALNDNVGRGKIPQTYREAESGRLYGTGELSLQTVTREAKRVALCDTHEYDFENCHYRLLTNVTSQSEINTPVIDEYLDDPTAYRTNLATELDITCSQAKKCLLATLCGATQSMWADCAIPTLIGPEKAECLYEIPRFNDLTFEILEVGEVMRRNASRLPNGAIINCRGKACHGTPKQELAHLLQGLEAELLHVVIEEYGKDILIIQHDGFALADYVDPTEIETILFDRTGFDMPVTYEHLTLPGFS